MARLTDSLVEILELNTRLFRNCIEGLDDESIRSRITGNTNNIHFISCHLVDARFFISTVIGWEAPTPFPELASVTTIEEMPDPGPSLAFILENWDDISAVLPDRLRSLDQSRLGSRSTITLPTRLPSLLGALAFFMQHESYHIGQMALLRKALGFARMAYD